MLFLQQLSISAREETGVHQHQGSAAFFFPDWGGGSVFHDDKDKDDGRMSHILAALPSAA